MSLQHLLRLPAMLCLLALSSPLWAQSHEQASGPYVVQASVVATNTIAEESAQVHGIEQESNRAILNVIVMKKGDPQEHPLRAQVQAYATNLAGVRHQIELEEIEVNNRVSYTGTFSFLPREVVDFDISAQPEGSGETINMKFRERIWKTR